MFNPNFQYNLNIIRTLEQVANNVNRPHTLSLNYYPQYNIGYKLQLNDYTITDDKIETDLNILKSILEPLGLNVSLVIDLPEQPYGDGQTYNIGGNELEVERFLTKDWLELKEQHPNSFCELVITPDYSNNT